MTVPPFILPPNSALPNATNYFAPQTTPGGTSGHWDYPDYASLLAKWMQPYMQQYQGEIAAQRAQAETNAKLAQSRYNQGQYSTLSRIGKAEEYAKFQNTQNTAVAQHQHELQLAGITRDLASRGMLSSGETGYQQGEEAFRYQHLNDQQKEQYKQQQYGFGTQRTDAENQLVDYLRGVQQAFADAQRQGLLGLASQQQNIAGTLSQLYRPSWVEDQQAGGAYGGAIVNQPTGYASMLNTGQTGYTPYTPTPVGSPYYPNPNTLNPNFSSMPWNATTPLWQLPADDWRRRRLE